MPYENKTGFPSVTDIISPYVDKRWFTAEHRERGSAVHACAAAHLLGLYVPKLKPDWQGYFDSFKRWADLVIDKVFIVEKRLSDKRLGYCGQPDTIVILRGDRYAVLPDWKSSQAYQSWWEIQVGAYRALAEANGYETYKGLSVRMKKDGSGCLVNEHKSNVRAWNIFVGLLNAHKFFNR